MSKIKNDKYYTPKELAKYCVNKTKEVIGVPNITEYIEPAGGDGAFLDYLPQRTKSYDIVPEDNRVEKQDYLDLDIMYKEGRCIITNPPFGSRMSLARKFYKKSCLIGDYIAFILPISQLNNVSSLYQFDLIHSEDLGTREYSNRKLRCCFNIYRRPQDGELNKRNLKKLKDIKIHRQDSKKYDSITNFDIRMCYWGSAGKILEEGESYAGEYKIIINNKDLKQEILNVLNNVNWKEELKCIAELKIQQFHIYQVLRKYIKNIK